MEVHGLDAPSTAGFPTIEFTRAEDYRRKAEHLERKSR
jgi:hypothetical protein